MCAEHEVCIRCFDVVIHVVCLRLLSLPVCSCLSVCVIRFVCHFLITYRCFHIVARLLIYCYIQLKNSMDDADGVYSEKWELVHCRNDKCAYKKVSFLAFLYTLKSHCRFHILFWILSCYNIMYIIMGLLCCYCWNSQQYFNSIKIVGKYLSNYLQ